MPTVCAPVGSSRKRAPSLPFDDWASALALTRAESAKLKRSRLIYQHDRDIVTDGVPKTTFLAEELLLGFAILELTLALGTNQDFEQTRRQAHFAFPVAV